ncbi:GrpB family protein [Arsukibacterium sp.]|uniref:GrpB family protein n=1 Tax=Arsukibacterium sp. TaxID=1977258 RepID=UPI00299E0D06|nr:GrpB family protein [Arsukibacterium sp.]MDX1677531.1 GrpB family protein [Arsukibacterium sp.]
MASDTSQHGADKVQHAVTEPVKLAEWSKNWATAFLQEKQHLQRLLGSAAGRIEHFGSTAIPGMPAKPIVDMLIEVQSLSWVRDTLAAKLAPLGYQLFWRPTAPGDTDVAYAWFIKRDSSGQRTHHLHMLLPDSVDWQKLRFRDYLRAHPAVAADYAQLKRAAAREFANDRKAYNKAKAAFIRPIMLQLADS